MAWETFSKSERRPIGVDPPPQVTIRPYGYLGLNRGAREALGKPARVRFLWNPQTRVVGLKPVKVTDQQGYKVQWSTYSGTVGAPGFFRHYGLLYKWDSAQIRPAKMVRGILTFPVDDPT